MNFRKAAYWTTTAFTALLPLLTGGIGYVLHLEAAVENVVSLGYPTYLLTFLGVCKILGGAVLLAPGLPRLKEWAYAGLALNLAAASFSHAVTGHPAQKVIGPLVLLAIAGVSWALRPASRTLAAPAPEPSSDPARAKGGSPEPVRA